MGLPKILINNYTVVDFPVIALKRLIIMIIKQKTYQLIGVKD